MMDLMSWEECENSFIRKSSVDLEKVASIMDTAGERLEFTRSLAVTKKNVSFIFEQYYEIIKELLVALMLKSGLRSKNHQCLFTFFAKEYPFEAEVRVMLQMSYLRNRLDYYGERVEHAYFIENYKSFEEIIALLIKLIK